MNGLRKLLPESALHIRDEPYDHLMNLWGEGNEMYEELKSKRDNITWYNKLTVEIFIKLIQIRLCLLMEPFLYRVVYIIWLYLLIFNKLLIIAN